MPISSSVLRQSWLPSLNETSLISHWMRVFETRECSDHGTRQRPIFLAHNYGHRTCFSPSFMNALPRELFEHIIDNVRDAPETLRNCSLVCASGLPSVRRYIFGQKHLLPAIKPGYLAIAHFLLTLPQIDVNTGNGYFTPFSTAASYGRETIVSEL